MRVSGVIASAAAVAIGFALANLPSGEADAPTVQADVTRLVGSALPAVTLRTLTGDSVSLESTRSGKPTLLIITKASDTESCARFAFEVRLLRRKLPRVRILLVGSGPDVAGFDSYFAEERMAEHALLDPTRALVHALGLESEPAVLFTDSGGTVLLVDTRLPGRSSQFPIGSVLPALSESLLPLLP